ncbi:hypothetical protein D9M72_413150 [compost metagenome]
MHRPGLSAGGHGGPHSRQQALGEHPPGVLEGIYHRLDHRRRCQQIASRHALLAGPRVVHAERLAPGEQRRAAVLVDHRDLAVLAVAVAGQRPIQRLAGRQPLGQPVEDLRAQRRQGDVLRGHRAGAGAQPRAARADGDAGGTDGDAELAGVGATANDGKGHGASLFLPVVGDHRNHVDLHQPLRLAER